MQVRLHLVDSTSRTETFEDVELAEFTATAVAQYYNSIAAEMLGEEHSDIAGKMEVRAFVLDKTGTKFAFILADNCGEFGETLSTGIAYLNFV